ncbi:unnamed protein product [Sympodiomycopsis kandeliae]
MRGFLLELRKFRPEDRQRFDRAPTSLNSYARSDVPLLLIASAASQHSMKRGESRDARGPEPGHNVNGQSGGTEYSRHYMSSQRSTAHPSPYHSGSSHSPFSQMSGQGRMPYAHTPLASQHQYHSNSPIGPFGYHGASAGPSSPSLNRTENTDGTASAGPSHTSSHPGQRHTSPSASPHASNSTIEHPSNAANAPSASSQAVKQNGTKVSCLECRSSKVKCMPQTTSSRQSLGQPGLRCARCQRLDKACVFEKHKRGRKPDSWTYSRLEKQLESLLTELRSDKDTSRKASAEDDDPDTSTRDDSTIFEEPAQKRLRTETAEILSNWRASSTNAGSKSDRIAALSRALEGRPSAREDESAKQSDTQSQTDIQVKKEDPLPETGLPSLSNPLKLLAQASAGGEEFETFGESIRSAAGTSGSRPVTRNGDPKTTSPRLANRMAPGAPLGRGAQDGLGIYEEKLENGPELDPISQELISLEHAQYLWSIFLDKLSHPLMLLDSNIYTFEYTRPRSSMLLSVGLALTARYVPATPDFPTDVIADDIDKHVLEKIIPTLIMQGKRSQHCAKALMLLAAYNGQSIPLSEDRSFSYVSWAFSMSVELDLNRRLFSMSADQTDEVLQRTLRERERTFLEAWAYSFSIALHHGRRCNLSIHDPVVTAASQWHRSPFAIPEDAGLVSNIQLRQLIARNLDYFLQHVAPAMPKTSADGPPDQACRLLLEFHRRSITADLDAWHATWVVPVVSEARPFRLHSTAYYHAYATLILHSLPMKHGTENEPCLKPFSDQAHRAALSVVAYFLRLPEDQIIWGHNSIHVTVGFAVVYALRETDPAVSVAEMVEKVIERMEMAGNVTAHRRSFAMGVAKFLRRMLRVRCLRRDSKNGSQDGQSNADAGANVSQGASTSIAPAATQDNVEGGLSSAPSAASGLGSTAPSFASNSDVSAAPTTQTQYSFAPMANMFDPTVGLDSSQNANGLFDPPAGTFNANHLPNSSASNNSDLANLFADLPAQTGAGDDQSQTAMMDNLMMNHPIGVQFNSLLGQNADWSNDWSFFLPGGSGGNQHDGQQG